MITKVITSGGKHIHVLSQADLDVVDACGERWRAYCPIHGSDHQRSMSIDTESGWGYCHQCHATVFVEDCNTEIAATLKRGEYRRDSLSGPPASADILPPPYTVNTSCPSAPALLASTVATR